ncbi:hypothetical protein [Pseudomonas sp. NY15354]|uniref:hypothetical protein n=1 Tax=Pseudomonas sp. NY15354 TaxID=3400351 RepID=UPI003A8AC684
MENMVAGVSTPLLARLTGFCMFFDQDGLVDGFVVVPQSAKRISMPVESCG